MPLGLFDAQQSATARAPTRMEQRFLDFAADIATTEASKTDDLAFLASMVVRANLPYRDPGDCSFVRRNGTYTLTLQAPPHIGLPYGRYPRLILAFLCSEAVRARTREIHLGDSLSAFMRTLGITASGGPQGPLRRFREQAARLLATTISCSWTDTAGGVSTRSEAGTRIASRSMIWWTSSDSERSRETLGGGWILLSPDFYEEILAHPVPLDRRVLRALTSSFALDLYAWATYRVSRLRRPVSIPWPALVQQFGSQQKALRNFRRKTRKALERIRILYPQLRYEVTTESLRLYPSPTHVSRAR